LYGTDRHGRRAGTVNSREQEKQVSRRLFILGACIAVALATAASPALADGQSATSSIGTVQVGSASVSPDASAAAPVNANAPVCVLAVCGGADGGQSTGSTTAGSQTTGQAPGAQSAAGSIGTVQVGAANVDPTAAASVPVNANAPVCGVAACRGGTARQTTGNTSASHSKKAHSQGGSGSQKTHHSFGTVQIGSANVDPPLVVSAPVDANAPVCAAASCGGGHATQSGGNVDATSSQPGQGGSGDQSTGGSIGTVQLGSADVSPSIALSVPVSADAPACVLAACGGGTSQETGGGGNGGGGGIATPFVPTTGNPGGLTLPAGRSAVLPTANGAPATSTKPRSNGRGVAGRSSAGGNRGSTRPSPSSGVLAATRLAKGTLPFTGLALPAVLALALTLLATGTLTRARTAA
jgi:hypothetical protein